MPDAAMRKTSRLVSTAGRSIALDPVAWRRLGQPAAWPERHGQIVRTMVEIGLPAR